MDRSTGRKNVLVLRPIAPEDEAFLSRVYASTRTEELAAVPWSEQQKAEFLESQFQFQHQHYQKNFCAAAFDIVMLEEEPIGRFYVDRRHDEIRLIDIALLPQWRNEGFGSSLLLALLEESRALDVPVRIHVEQDNPAMRLYERLGFGKVDDAGVYLLMQWTPLSDGRSGTEPESEQVSP